MNPNFDFPPPAPKQTSLTTRLRWLLALTACGLAGVALPASETRPKVKEVGAPVPASALYIGNSFFYYNNSLHGHVGRLITEGLPEFQHRASSVTISGAGLDWHDVDSYFRPNAIGRYSFGAGNEIRFNQRERLFDLAIMMDCSQCPLHPELGSVFTEFARKHSATVRKHGARPVFFMSWAYQDKPEMSTQLAEAYTRAGNDNDAFVIPAGLAFARSIRLRPDVNLYVADKRHPSLAGTYLAACTTYAALFRKSPVGLTYHAGLPAETARHLQTVAWETVQDYFRP